MSTGADNWTHNICAVWLDREKEKKGKKREKEEANDNILMAQAECCHNRKSKNVYQQKHAQTIDKCLFVDMVYIT